MKLLFSISIVTFAILLISADCSTDHSTVSDENTVPALLQKTGFHYTLEQPDETHILPDALLEVSGLTDLSSTEIACVQDEQGIIFRYDLTTKSTGEEIEFAGAGDYEGLTRVDDILFSLSSEGTLYEIAPKKNQYETITYDLGLTAPDNEGLCYDEKEKRLLIAPKSKLGKGPEYKDQRAVFMFDLKKRKMENEPLFYYNISDIYAYAEANNLPVHPSYKKNGTTSKHPNFRPSSLSVHPVTDEVYIISAEDLCLVIFDKEGNIKGFSALDPGIFSKPEGLTFFPDGTMVITNEGVESKPTLVLFKPKNG